MMDKGSPVYPRPKLAEPYINMHTKFQNDLTDTLLKTTLM